MDPTAANRHMQPSSRDPLSLAHGEGSGKPGLLRAVSFSSGWYFTTGFGH
jgi:hypothetical protein